MGNFFAVFLLIVITVVFVFLLYKSRAEGWNLGNKIPSRRPPGDEQEEKKDPYMPNPAKGTVLNDIKLKIHKKNGKGKTFHLSESKCTIGRDPKKCTIVIPDDSVSQTALQLERATYKIKGNDTLGCEARVLTKRKNVVGYYDPNNKIKYLEYGQKLGDVNDIHLILSSNWYLDIYIEHPAPRQAEKADDSITDKNDPFEAFRKGTDNEAQDVANGSGKEGQENSPADKTKSWNKAKVKF